MTARKCFTAKILAGKVSERAGRALMDTLNEFERSAREKLGDDPTVLRQAAADTAAFADKEATRKADLTRRAVVAQSNVLRGVKAVADKVEALRKTGNAPPLLKGEDRSPVFAALSAFFDADAHELATWNSVTKLKEDLIGRAHSTFRDAIGRMRSRALGFKAQTVHEIEFLRAAFGGEASAAAREDAAAWFKTEVPLADQFIAAGGEIAKRENYFPNPSVDPAKARAMGPQRLKALINETVGRDKVIDFATDERMGDARWNHLVDGAVKDMISGDIEGPPTAVFRGGTMLANSRQAPRLFHMRDAEAWMRFAETVGTHASPYAAAIEHIEHMGRDTALLRILGPNPEATLRFMLDVLDREPGRLAVSVDDLTADSAKKATRINERIGSRTESEKKSLRNLFADVTGANRVPVSTEIARRAADARSLLMGAQLGSAMLSSLNDPATLLMTSRMAGLKAGNVMHWTSAMMTEKGSEVFAAQTGFMMDVLTHTARSMDKVMGDTVRSGVAAKIGGAVIRASGLRKWTEALKAGFWLGSIAQVASERTKAFAELEPAFRAGLERVGIGDAEWKIFQRAPLYEPRPNATFLRPLDVAALGGKQAEAASEKLAQYVNTWMDYAVVESNPRVRAMVIGDSRPGTISGELRRSLAMYRFFSGGLMYLHGARALARGWDGSRLGHAAFSFGLISLMGALSMQAKEIAAGRDPLNLDPSKPHGIEAWGKAILQGGGLGVFGDILQVDQTKYGNTWASTFAGPVAGFAEATLGDFLLKNVRLAAEGKDTHFLGDAVYTAARYMPGTSLWYARLAFQRAVVDRLALWADPRAPERFARMEATAQKDWGQQYWLPPGHTDARHAPDIATMWGGR